MTNRTFELRKEMAMAESHAYRLYCDCRDRPNPTGDDLREQTALLKQFIAVHNAYELVVTNWNLPDAAALEAATLDRQLIFDQQSDLDLCDDDDDLAKEDHLVNCAHCHTKYHTEAYTSCPTCKSTLII